MSVIPLSTYSICLILKEKRSIDRSMCLVSYVSLSSHTRAAAMWMRIVYQQTMIATRRMERGGQTAVTAVLLSAELIGSLIKEGRDMHTCKRDVRAKDGQADASTNKMSYSTAWEVRSKE